MTVPCVRASNLPRGPHVYLTVLDTSVFESVHFKFVYVALVFEIRMLLKFQINEKLEFPT